MPAEFDLQRFVDAQDRVYDTVLAELRAGRKRTHWIWFVFPQLAAAGPQPDRAALRHLRPGRGPRLPGAPGARAAAAGVHAGWWRRSTGRSIEDIFGWPDNLKVRSSMTLFAHATDDNADFVAVLDKFYAGFGRPGGSRRRWSCSGSGCNISQPCGGTSTSLTTCSGGAPVPAS